MHVFSNIIIKTVIRQVAILYLKIGDIIDISSRVYDMNDLRCHYNNR